MRHTFLHNTFAFDSEGWQVYDYETSVRAGHEVFRPVTWEPTGGPTGAEPVTPDSRAGGTAAGSVGGASGGGGYVWADESRWNIDTPETPRSILALVVYRAWVNRPPVDLRDAKLTVHLSGRGLDLKGGSCHFWAWNLRTGTRWHMSKVPLPIEPDRWAESPHVVTLHNDPALWRRSWVIPSSAAAGSLDQVLAQCDAYGFSFLGFSENVTGRLCLGRFELKPTATAVARR